MENFKLKTKTELIQIIESYQTTENEIYLSELLSSMQDFIFVFDKDQHFKFVNVPESSKLYLNSDKFIGKKHTDIMPSDVDKKFQIAFEKNKTGKFDSFEYQLIIENQKIDFSAGLSPIFKKGIFAGSIAIVSDISQEKIIRKALIKEVEFSNKILNTSNAIIVGLDKNHMIKLFNKGAEKKTGYKTEEVIGKDWFKIFFPENILEEMNIVWKKHWGAKSGTNTNAIRIKSGQERMISWQTTGFYDDEDVSNHLLISIGEDITDKQNAENKLRIERDNMKHIFESMEDGIYIVNQEFDIEYVNHVLIKDIGDYKGKKCYDFFHNRTEVCPWCKNDEVFAGNTVHWEWYSQKNGKTYDLIDTPLKNIDGSISKLEIFRDISHHAKQKKELKRNEQKFRLLADYTYDWEFWIDTEGNYVYSSPSCERITGYTPEEFKANPKLLYDIVHPDFKEHIHQHYQNEDNKITSIYSTEFQIITKNGKLRWLEYNCNPIFDYEDNFIGRRGNNRDITESKLTDSKLIESEKRFKDFFYASPDAVSISSLSNGKYIEVNDAFSEMTGFKRSEVIGQTFSGLNLWANIKDRDTFIKEIQATGSVKNMEIQFRLQNGNTITSLASANIIYINNEPHILAINRDITVIKKVEKDLEVYRNNLEKLVKERTEELEIMNKELSEANKKLEEFNELFIGREFRIKELRDKIKKLEGKK